MEPFAAFHTEPLRPNADRAKYVVLVAWIGFAVYLVHFIISLGYFLTAKDQTYVGEIAMAIAVGYTLLSLIPFFC